jgi:hypothetical protein
MEGFFELTTAQMIECRGDRSSDVRYLKTFLITAPIIAVVAHYMTNEPMPWVRAVNPPG